MVVSMSRRAQVKLVCTVDVIIMHVTDILNGRILLKMTMGSLINYCRHGELTIIDAC
jgi:hypothetical protein